MTPISSQRIVFDVSVLESMFENSFQCKFCHHVPVKLFQSSAQHCLGIYIYLRCEYCFTTKNYWIVSERFSENIPVGNFTVAKRNASSYEAVLGARLAGIGKRGLDFIFCSVGIGRPLAYSTFSQVNRDLCVVLEHIATESMQRTIEDLRFSNGLTLDDIVHITGSYDGAYQKRCSRMGGGFSRYCFVSLIEIKTGRVVAYQVVCNSCPECTVLRHHFTGGILSAEEHRDKFELHLNICPANYRDFSSVSLEYEVSPEIMTQGYERGVICDGLVCDGDNKSFEK